MPIRQDPEVVAVRRCNETVAGRVLHILEDPPGSCSGRANGRVDGSLEIEARDERVELAGDRGRVRSGDAVDRNRQASGQAVRTERRGERGRWGGKPGWGGGPPPKKISAPGYSGPAPRHHIQEGA